jgi:hypothetical protein
LHKRNDTPYHFFYSILSVSNGNGGLFDILLTQLISSPVIIDFSGEMIEKSGEIVFCCGVTLGEFIS